MAALTPIGGMVDIDYGVERIELGPKAITLVFAKGAPTDQYSALAAVVQRLPDVRAMVGRFDRAAGAMKLTLVPNQTSLLLPLFLQLHQVARPRLAVSAMLYLCVISMGTQGMPPINGIGLAFLTPTEDTQFGALAEHFRAGYEELVGPTEVLNLQQPFMMFSVASDLLKPPDDERSPTEVIAEKAGVNICYTNVVASVESRLVPADRLLRRMRQHHASL